MPSPFHHTSLDNKEAVIHCLMLLDEVNCRPAGLSRAGFRPSWFCTVVVSSWLSGVDESPRFLSFPRTETQEDLQKLPPGFPRGAVPQPPFPPLSPTMAQMHTLMPAQSLQPTQQLEYKVRWFGLSIRPFCSAGLGWPAGGSSLSRTPQTSFLPLSCSSWRIPACSWESRES